MPTMTPLNLKRAVTAAVAFAPLLSWVTAGPFSITGTSTTYGRLVLILGLMGFAFTFRPAMPWGRLVDSALALAAFACALHDMIQVEHAAGGFGGRLLGVSPGTGLFIATVAGGAWVAWIGWRIKDRIKAGESIRSIMIAGQHTT